MPGPHPDDDVLADLAADVLPLEQARAIEAHVLACDRCAELLSDAEHVRSLLLADDPGPVPAEIWSRIESALSAAPSGGWADDGLVSAPPPSPPASRLASASGSSAWDGPDPLDDPGRWETSVRPAVRSGPVPATGSIRRITSSRRERRPDRRNRSLVLMLGAAAAVVVLVGVGALRLLSSGGSSSGASTAAMSEPSSGGAAGGNASRGVAATRITESGSDYTSATLAQRAKALVSGATRAAAGTGRAPSSASAAPRPAPEAAIAPDPSATDVTNPQRLKACLAALSASTDGVVAIDLARYQGREAAVLVLRADTGYEVWVVERTCAPGDEGALAETTLPG